MLKYSNLGYRSLKDLVYDFLREQIQKGNLMPGDSINMDKTAKKLGISKTPLREALIKLETEGFVKIIPWSGVVVNHLTLKDFQECYQIIGVLESSALLNISDSMKQKHINQMDKLNKHMQEMLEAKDFDSYYDDNLAFHSVYLDISDNEQLIKTIDILKKRIYEFSRPNEFIKEWEDVSLAEHKQLVKFLKQNEFKKAADYLKDVIWSFQTQKKFIKKYYKFNKEENSDN